jgi:RNA polymerase sigma factor (TIGR02999 family)
MTEAFAALFEKAQRGDRLARDAVYKLAFHRLRGIASALLRRERAGHTLQPTALVSELFLKLRRLETQILNEDHFFRMSARAMRQVLIDHARLRTPLQKMPLDLVPELLLPAQRSTVSPESRLAASMVFEKLRAMDAGVADTVWMRAVEGVTVQELSRRQKREEWRVRADYDFGVQWMAGRLRRQTF